MRSRSSSAGGVRPAAMTGGRLGGALSRAGDQGEAKPPWLLTPKLRRLEMAALLATSGGEVALTALPVRVCSRSWRRRES